MHQRTLGNGLTVSELGLGCMTMTGGYGSNPDRDSMLKHIRSAADQGITLFDTAEIYGAHANEALVGEALAPIRDRVSIATKFMQEIDEGRGEATGRMLRPDEVAAAADGSLRRLRTDVIDLYYQHRINPDIAIEEYAGAVGELITAGKVRHYGLSEPAADTIRRAHAVQAVTAIQSEYSLWWRRPEEEVLEVCAELGIGFVPFSPLGKGFLTGTIDTAKTFDGSDDMRSSIPRFSQDAMRHNVALVEDVKRIAERHRATAGQVAIAWLLAMREWIVPIPGTTNPDRLRENIGAADVALTAADVTELTRLSDSIAIQGGRYSDSMEAQTNV